MFITDQLPYSIRVLLESAVRNCDNFSIKEQDINNILHWDVNQNLKEDVEIPFKPARVILHVSNIDYIHSKPQYIWLYHNCDNCIMYKLLVIHSFECLTYDVVLVHKKCCF